MLRLFLLLSLHVSVSFARRIHRFVGEDETQPFDSFSSQQEEHLRHRRLLQEGASSAEDHRVISLPLLDELPTEFFAGHLRASEDGDKKLFYWLVAPPEEQRATAPLLIWLNGGPGCSSMEGFFLENGPLQFVPDDASGNWKLRPNPHSWHLAPAWVLYIDQPVGTGLSFTKSGNYCKNDEEVNQDFDYFMQQFLLTHRDKFLLADKLEMDRPLYFSGESHAGHYIPSMMDYILQKQQTVDEERVVIHVGGAAIGNGWFDPYRQYAATDVAYGFGLVSLPQKARLESLEKECQKSLNSGSYSPSVCFNLLNIVVQQAFGEQANEQVVIYDARKTESKRGPKPFPEGHELIETYLGGLTHPQPGGFEASYMNVLKALHATESVEAQQHYKECTDPPYYALKDQDGVGVMPEIANLLNADIPMLFYNGMYDLVCNHISTERSLLALEWKDADAYADTERAAWMLNGETVGYMQQHANLMYLKILNSGHMVPKDTPDVALAMMSGFLQQQSFSSSTQRLGRETWIESSC